MINERPVTDFIRKTDTKAKSAPITDYHPRRLHLRSKLISYNKFQIADRSSINDEIETKIGSNPLYERRSKHPIEPKAKESRTTDDLIEFTSDAAN